MFEFVRRRLISFCVNIGLLDDLVIEELLIDFKGAANLCWRSFHDVDCIGERVDIEIGLSHFIKQFEISAPLGEGSLFASAIEFSQRNVLFPQPVRSDRPTRAPENLFASEDCRGLKIRQWFQAGTRVRRVICFILGLVTADALQNFFD